MGYVRYVIIWLSRDCFPHLHQRRSDRFLGRKEHDRLKEKMKELKDKVKRLEENNNFQCGSVRYLNSKGVERYLERKADVQ